MKNVIVATFIASMMTMSVAYAADTMGKDAMKKDEMSMKKDAMKKDEMGMKKDAMKKDEMGMKKDAMSH